MTKYRNILWPFLLTVCLAAVLCIALSPVLTDSNAVFAFNDANIESALSPTFSFPQILIRSWDNQFFFGKGNKQYPLTVVALLESILGPIGYRRAGVLFMLLFCGLSFYWTCRQFRLSRAASALASAATTLSGFAFTFAVVGLPVRPVALGFTAVALGFIERARQKRLWLDYAVAGGFVGLTVAEVPDVGALLAMTAAAGFLWLHLADKSTWHPRRLAATGGCFALFILCSFLVAYQTVGTMIATNIQGVSQGQTETPEAKYQWATQWSIPKAETWDMVAGTYHGTSMRSHEAPYWGLMGRSPGWERTQQGFRNFKLTGWHVGVLPALFIMVLPVLLLRRHAMLVEHPDRRSLGWMVTIGSVLALMLSWGRFFPAYRVIFALPFFGTIRNPDKWNGPFMLLAGLGLAIVLHVFFELASKKDGGEQEQRRFLTSFSGVAGAIAVVAILLLGSVLTSKAVMASRLAAEGYGDFTEVIWRRCIWSSLRVLVLTGLATGFVFLAIRRRFPPALKGMAVAVVFLLLTTPELIFINQFYIQKREYKHVLRSNPMFDYLDRHRADGRIKLLPPQHPLLNGLRMSLLQAKGYDLFEPISLPRVPVVYENLLNAFQGNPVRLWELGSLRFFLTLEGAREQLDRLDGNRGRFTERLAMDVDVRAGTYIPVHGTGNTRRPLRLIEFTGALPAMRLVTYATIVSDTPSADKQALAQMISPDFEPAREAIVHCDEPFNYEPGGKGTVSITDVTPTSAEATVETDRPTLLVRSVRYDPDWDVLLDGNPAPVLRTNYCFQGVLVPKGRHTVRFRYNPSLRPLYVAAAGRLGLLVLLLVSALRQDKECSRKGSQKRRDLTTEAPSPGEEVAR